MVRASRQQWVPRVYARRRHRTWMRSMILASLGWGVWWVGVVIVRFWPDLSLSFVSGRAVITALSVAFGVPGLAFGLLTLRARRSWLPFAMIAIFANLALLLLPILLDGYSLPPRR